jgi:hypothetical protein
VLRPGHANAGRGEWFRATLRRPAAVSAIVLGASGALVLGSALGGAAAALAAPVVVVALVLAWAWAGADARAERAFWHSVADALGYQPFLDVAAMSRTTPLLHAGDRRRYSHALAGPLGGSGLPARLAHYRYDVRHENRKGDGVWTKYRFTVCLVEIEPGMRLFRGIYLRARRGVAGRVNHDWLRSRRLEAVELESSDFNASYELLVAPEQDAGRLRELFDPKTIVWLAEHPLRPHFEFRAGYLVVYVPGYLEDLGRVVWLLEAAERLAGRFVAEADEAAAARALPSSAAGSGTPG